MQRLVCPLTRSVFSAPVRFPYRTCFLPDPGLYAALLAVLSFITYMPFLKLPDRGQTWTTGVAMQLVSIFVWFPVACLLLRIALGSKRYRDPAARPVVNVSPGYPSPPPARATESFTAFWPCSCRRSCQRLTSRHPPLVRKSWRCKRLLNLPACKSKGRPVQRLRLRVSKAPIPLRER